MTAHCPSCHNQFDQPYVRCPNDGTVLLVADEDFAAGATIGKKYRIVGQIAGGAVSSVYEAIHQDFATRLALKVLRGEFCSNENQLDRFQTEAECAIGLVHPHVVRVFDFGTSPQPHIAMDFIEGKSLAGLLQENGAMPWQPALEVMRQVADGMAAVHAAGLIHRDIKPSNIMIDSETGLVKIIDFGVAKDILELHRNTRTGETLGSPPYMSPEQCRGQSLDARSDIYSFGCTLYELLTDVRPFAGKTFVDSMFKHLETEAPPLKKTRRDLRFPNGLNRLIDRCLALEPSARYQSTAELMLDIERVSDGRGREIAKIKRRKKHLLIRFVLGTFVFFLIAAAIMTISLITPRMGANQIITGDSAQPMPTKIVINGPVELDSLTKDEIYRLREKSVAPNADLLARPYKPLGYVFGGITDRLPWWGMKGFYWYDGRRGPTAPDGQSLESVAVVNPFLLVSIEFEANTKWQTDAIGDPDKIENFPYVCLPGDLIWQPKQHRFDVTYRISDWQRRVQQLNYPNKPKPHEPCPQGSLIFCNAEDFGYQFATYSIEGESVGAKPAPPVFKLDQWMREGASCGYPCNSIGDPLFDFRAVTATPSTAVRVLLWKERPRKTSPPDLVGFIHFI